MNEELRKRILNSVDFLLERFTEEEVLTILDALKNTQSEPSLIFPTNNPIFGQTITTSSSTD
jgi:hypothetical protein